MERKISVSVRQKIATADKDALYICGNSDFIIAFDFDEDWAKHEIKTARFKYGGGYIDVIFDGSECPVPVISDTYSFDVGVYAGNLETTTPARVPAKKSILCGSGLPKDPPPDVYAQIMTKVNEIAQKGVTDEQLQAAIGAYLEENPFDGVTQEELTAAVNAALAKAKESGEFKGEPGEPGYTPQKGVDYFDGAPGEPGEPGHTPVKGEDYFTEADKTEIVNDVLEQVNVSGSDPLVYDWARRELFNKDDLPVGTQSFVTIDGVEYYRYHAGPTNFTWVNPKPNKGAVTITARGVAQYGSAYGTRLHTVYDDGTYGPELYIIVSGESRTVTVTTDATKTLAKITGNYDMENWVLLDMSVMSVQADYFAGIPAATENVAGGVKADQATETDTQPVRIGEDGKLYTDGEEKWEIVSSATLTEDVVRIDFDLEHDYKRIMYVGKHLKRADNSSGTNIILNGRSITHPGSYFVHPTQDKCTVVSLTFYPDRGVVEITRSSAMINSNYNEDYIGHVFKEFEGYANTLSFRLNNANCVVTAGSSYTLWGVRA